MDHRVRKGKLSISSWMASNARTLRPLSASRRTPFSEEFYSEILWLTTSNYVLNVARDFATEEFNLDAQRRMLKALPASSYCRRSHAGFISKMERAVSLVSRSPSPSSASE